MDINAGSVWVLNAQRLYRDLFLFAYHHVSLLISWLQARECVGKEQSPKRGHTRCAAKVVSASSRDHADRRAQSTRDTSATSTRGHAETSIASAVVVRSRAQVPAWRFCAGASGHFAPCASQILLAGAPSP